MKRARKIKPEVEKVEKRSIRQIFEDFISKNPVPHYIRYFHKFANYKYETTIYYNKQPYTDNYRKYETYGPKKTIDYIITFANTESTTLNKEYARQINNRPVTDSTSPYPLAVRYVDNENNLYLIERPPTQIDLDFSIKKHGLRKSSKCLIGRKIWIPWTVSVVNMGNGPSNYSQSLYVSNGPISSLQDEVLVPMLPNIFGDGRICFGDSTMHLSQRITSGSMKYNIADVFIYMFNDYFCSWNADLAYNFRLSYSVLNDMGVFQRIKDMKLKSTPRGFDSTDYWMNSNGRYWQNFLYCMSFLSYEETVLFYKNCVSEVYKNDHYHNFTRRKIIDILRMHARDATDYVDSPDIEEYTLPNVQGMWGCWRKVLDHYNNIIFIKAQVDVVNIPEGMHIDQSIVSNPNLTAFLYADFYRQLSSEYDDYCRANSIHYLSRRMDGHLSYDRCNPNNTRGNLVNSDFQTYLHRDNNGDGSFAQKGLFVELDYNTIVFNGTLVNLKSVKLDKEMESV